MSNEYNGNRPEMATPEYKSWRICVFSRDNWKCVKCGRNDRLQAHHIKSWARYPDLRYIVSNGVALCHACHDEVTGKEQAYEEEFQQIVATKLIKQKSGKRKNPKLIVKRKWKPKNPYNRYG